MQLTDGRLAAVLDLAGGADPKFALSATGTAAVVGLPGVSLSGAVGASINRFDAAFDHEVTLPDASTLPVSFASADDVTNFAGDALSLELPGGFSIDGPLTFQKLESTIGGLLDTRLEVAATDIETFL